MAYHPVNLGFRFLLEVVGLSAFAFWGWAWGGWIRWPLAIGAVLGAMAVWGIFRTPEDRTSGSGVVATPGPVRLAIELGFFALAILALFTAHANDRADWLAIALAVAVIIHYVLSWDRVRWLLGS
ncbi:hypothetical protein BH23CHL2_BH23CHL2_24880 [soil metagenome]